MGFQREIEVSPWSKPVPKQPAVGPGARNASGQVSKGREGSLAVVQRMPEARQRVGVTIRKDRK
jgi:hypothetical protein